MDAPIIFDIGSENTMVGFAGLGSPQFIFPSLVGYSRGSGTPIGQKPKHVYVGDEAQAKCGVLLKEYPIQRGLVADSYYLEKIWQYAFKQKLRCDPRENPLMMLEHPLTPKHSREDTIQTFMEHLNVPAVFFSNPCVAAARAVGVTSGVSLCMGGQTTYCMAVKDGKGMIRTLNTIDIGAQDITVSLSKFFKDKYQDSHVDTAEDARIKLGYVALDYEYHIQRPDNEVSFPYEAPDGQIWQLHHELFTHNEVLFKPELYGLEKDGIHHMVYNSIMKCDLDIHRELLHNIVLSGGNSLTRGLDARLIKELKILSPEHSDHVRLELLPHRRRISFFGASILSTTLGPADWITKAEYDEFGPSIVHTKCPIGVM